MGVSEDVPQGPPAPGLLLYPETSPEPSLELNPDEPSPDDISESRLDRLRPLAKEYLVRLKPGGS